LYFVFEIGSLLNFARAGLELTILWPASPEWVRLQDVTPPLAWKMRLFKNAVPQQPEQRMKPILVQIPAEPHRRKNQILPTFTSHQAQHTAGTQTDLDSQMAESTSVPLHPDLAWQTLHKGPKAIRAGPTHVP
jgi:hypothetical protein